MTDEHHMTSDERYSQDAIDSLQPVEPSARLQRLVAQIPLEHPRAPRVFWPFGSLWVPGLSLAAAAVLGAYVGRGWSELRETYSPNADSTSARVDEEWLEEDNALFEANSAALRENTEEESRDDGATGTELDDPALEDLLVFATTAEFEPSSWELSAQNLSDEVPEETY